MPRKKPEPRRRRYSGSVIVRRDGRVLVRAWVPSPSSGDVMRHDEYLPQGSTKRDGLRRLDEINAARDAGTLRVFDRMTVSEYLDSWLIDRIVPNRKPKTVDNYRYAISKLTSIGAYELRALTRRHVQQLQRDLLASLAQPSTVFVLTVLKAALNAAVEDDLLFRSPMVGVKVGTPHSKEVIPPTPHEARAMLEALNGHPLQVALELAVYRGLRSGEIRGLTWEAVDLEAGDLDIRHTLYLGSQQPPRLVTPKTALSVRWVPLNAELIAALTRRRVQQLADRLRAGGDWHNALDLVITGRTGGHITAGTLRTLYGQACNAANVPVRTVHALRHTANTIMAQAGVDERTRMAILGHSNVKINARYVHSDRERVAAALALLEERIRNA